MAPYAGTRLIDELFEVYDRPIEEIDQGPILRKWGDRLLQSRRFDDSDYYEPGIIVDNNRDHTLRMREMARCCLVGQELEHCLAIIDCHDIPESNTKRDLTVPARLHNPALDAEKRQAEQEFATTFFSEDEKHFFQEYTEAGEFVKGERPLWEVSQPIALVVKILDKVEGLATLHRALTTFIKGDQYEKNNVPTDWVLLFGVEECMELHRRLEGQRYQIASLCLELLEAVLDYVRGLWRTCPIDRTPVAISEFFGFE